MGADDVVVINDDDGFVIIIHEGDHGGDRRHDPLDDALEHRFGGHVSENQRLFWGLVAYLLVAVLPALGLATASSVIGGWMVSLQNGQAASPWVIAVAPWLPAATVAALMAGTVSGVLIVAWSARTLPSRIAGICLLFTVQTSVVLLGGSLAAFGGLVAAHQPRPHVTVKHPQKQGSRATVSRLTDDPCGWVLTESQGAKPMAQEVSRVTCSCSGMPDASVRWNPTGPVIVDASSGLPYVCAPPPRRCATTPGPASPLAMLVLLLFRRRREPETARSRRDERA